MQKLNKDKLITFLGEQMKQRKQLMDKDFNGGLHNLLTEHNYIKWLKEAIERGEFD